MLLALTLLILIAACQFDDILGQIFGIFIIAIAGAESAIGLSIIIAFYRLRGSISISQAVRHSSQAPLPPSGGPNLPS